MVTLCPNVEEQVIKKKILKKHLNVKKVPCEHDSYPNVTTRKWCKQYLTITWSESVRLKFTSLAISVKKMHNSNSTGQHSIVESFTNYD